MCGIFGWSLKPKADRSAIPTLAACLTMSNDDRGGHSWGASADGSIRRGLGCMAHAYSKLYRMFSRSSVVMAHTRYATTGARTKDNAHPFEIRGIVGAHNGIVYNHDWLNRQYGRSCAVDSMHLFEHLADSIPTGDIEAYGAIEWYDREEPSAVNLAYFNGGDLSVARTDIGIVWSSDRDHLESSMGWAGLDFQEFDIRPSRIYSAHDGELYELGSIKVGVRKATTPARKWDDARWSTSWDSSRKATGSADNLPSQSDIEAAWDEWERWEAEQAEFDEEERRRIEDEERELSESFRTALARED